MDSKEDNHGKLDVKQRKLNRQISIARGLFVLNAVIWLVFGILSVSGKAGSSNLRLIYGLLMVGNALIMLIFSWLISKRSRWVFYAALSYLGLNIVLTITDQFGVFDLIILLIDLGLFGVVLSGRGFYMSED